MTTTCTGFTGSDLFAWINLSEPIEVITEADMDLAVLADTEAADAAEQAQLAAEEEQHRNELYREFA
jgi:hypothetical protein